MEAPRTPGKVRATPPLSNAYQAQQTHAPTHGCTYACMHACMHSCNSTSGNNDAGGEDNHVKGAGGDDDEYGDNDDEDDEDDGIDTTKRKHYPNGAHSVAPCLVSLLDQARRLAHAHRLYIKQRVVKKSGMDSRNMNQHSIDDAIWS